MAETVQNIGSRSDEHRFRTLIESLSHVIFTLDDQGRFTYLSPRCEDILGIPPEALIGRSITSVVIPDDKDRLCRKYHEVRDGESYPSDYQVVDKDGHVHKVRAVSEPFIDSEGRHGVIGAISEISNWENREVVLRQTEEKVRKLVEYSKDGILLTDEKGILIEWSPAMEKISGIRRSEAIGQAIWDVSFSLLPSEKRSAGGSGALKESFFAALAAGTGSWLDHSMEYEIEIPGGERKTVESLQFVIPGESETRVGGIIRDITDRMRADRTAREANRKLHLMTSISRHDITNQLTILGGYLALLEQGSASHDRDEIFRVLNRSAVRIQRILQFTSEYQNVGIKAPVWQDLARTISTAKTTIAASSVNIVLEPLCSDMEVFADPLLVRVFYNLIDNSLRHGETVTEIRFRCSIVGDNLVIGYEDNGIGIPDEIRPELFRRGAGKNTGYGLFLIREILAMTGFTIDENGVSGKGVRFRITVPGKSFRMRRQGSPIVP